MRTFLLLTFEAYRIILCYEYIKFSSLEHLPKYFVTIVVVEAFVYEIISGRFLRIGQYINCLSSRNESIYCWHFRAAYSFTYIMEIK